MPEKTFEDILKIGDPKEFMQWALNNPDEVAQVAADKGRTEKEEGKKAATFLVMWVSKQCSPESSKALANAIGYNDTPLFFKKRKKARLVTEIIIANTAVAIFATNLAVNPDRAKSVIDAYLDSAKTTMFVPLERVNPNFSSQYQKRISVYFSLLQSNSIPEMVSSFLTELGVNASSSSKGYDFLSQTLYSSIKEVHETLKATFKHYA